MFTTHIEYMVYEMPHSVILWFYNRLEDIRIRSLQFTTETMNNSSVVEELIMSL